MMQYNPFLKLNRLVVYTRDGSVAYDQEFHDGVNIIRGQNSSGKSTIANFIFYILGGEFKKWTKKAEECGDVYGEVFINTESITLKRTISKYGKQPMSIFWGPYDEAIQSSSEGWQIYPYSRSELKKSFSNALFLALGFPELRGDVDSNITMNQILRMLYIDQRSLTLDLLMTESFDSSITRKTIADLLFGVYDDSLYKDKLDLRDCEKDYEIKKKQFEGIDTIFRKSEEDTDIESITRKMSANNRYIDEIDLKIKELKEEAEKFLKTDIEEELRIVTVKRSLLEAKKNISILQSKIDQFEFELIDSRDFIVTLEKRSIALSDSILTRDVFFDLKMSHCPSCLSPIEAPIDDCHCELCRQILPEDKGTSLAKRMQQEVDNQLRESKKLYLEREHQLLEYKSNYPVLELKIKQLERDLDEALVSVNTQRSQELDNLLINKGALRSENDYLLKQLKALEQIEVLKKEIKKLEEKIALLKRRKTSKEYKQREKLKTAYEKIQSYTLQLLHNDLGRQAEFRNGKSVELDFEKNTFALDGENNFSESSNVYLKNSVRFAIFFASLSMDFFRLPRFILCDNIEDKGMEPARSKNFQNAIVEMSKACNVRHQIIFTTSMISSDLDDTEFCVGEFYTENKKTLLLR